MFELILISAAIAAAAAAFDLARGLPLAAPRGDLGERGFFAAPMARPTIVFFGDEYAPRGSFSGPIGSAAASAPRFRLADEGCGFGSLVGDLPGDLRGEPLPSLP
jgi:hypothetical protein